MPTARLIELNPFNLFIGFELIVAYALLGSTWLTIKTEGVLYYRIVSLARPITIALLTVICIVSVWTPFAYPDIAERWFSFPNIVFFSPVPALVLIARRLILLSLKNTPHTVPFLLALFVLFFGTSLWPMVATPPKTLLPNRNEPDG